jgi:hypothetical protein
VATLGAREFDIQAIRLLLNIDPAAASNKFFSSILKRVCWWSDEAPRLVHS